MPMFHVEQVRGREQWSAWNVRQSGSCFTWNVGGGGW